MSLDLNVVAQIMYLGKGEITPGKEEKVQRFGQKIADWKRDLVQSKAMKEEAAG